MRPQNGDHREESKLKMLMIVVAVELVSVLLVYTPPPFRYSTNKQSLSSNNIMRVRLPVALSDSLVTRLGTQTYICSVHPLPMTGLTSCMS